jgi:hypothetical protein
MRSINVSGVPIWKLVRCAHSTVYKSGLTPCICLLLVFYAIHFLIWLFYCFPGGQCLLCKSLSTEKASTVALVRTFDIVLAFVFQLMFFDHQPNIFSISGAILVSMCNIVILSTARCPSETHDDHKLPKTNWWYNKRIKNERCRVALIKLQRNVCVKLNLVMI